MIRGLRESAGLPTHRLDDLHRERGYEAGDALLRSLVVALRRATRSNHLVARSGDGRFALLLRECDEHETYACMQRLLLELERLESGPISASVAGEQIPAGSRIILACDAYHAMTSDRPYRARMTHADVFAELYRCAGGQFDPEVTESLTGHLYNERPGCSTAVG